MKKILAIDANSVLNRAFYGIRPLTTKDGLFTNAIYGVVNIVSAQIEALMPDAVIAAFDLKAPTFRHKMYTGYKATRKGMPPELASQLPYCKEVLDAMGISVVSCEGYEADDILGTVSTLSNEDTEVFILTGDRDALQLIGPHTTVYLITTGATVRYDTDAFKEKYGFLPPSLVDAKALMGDSSDNIPGVAGIGEKTALKLIAQYETIDALYSDIDNAPVGKSALEKLKAGKESAYMSYELAKICREAPICLDTEAIFDKKENSAELLRLFTKLEFSNFIKKFSLEKEAEPETAPSLGFKPSVFPDVSGNLYSIVIADRIYLYDGVNGIVSEFGGECEFFKNNSFITDDAKELYKILPDINIVFDTSLAGYVINSSEGDYSTERLSLKYLGISSRAEAEGDGEELVYDQYTARCEQIYKLKNILHSRIDEDGCGALYYDVELPLASVLARMEKCGFRVDTEGLQNYGKQLSDELSVIKERIYFLAGEEFNINSPKQLSYILFEKLNLPSDKKTKTGYSTNAEVLEKLRRRFPIVNEILEYRALSKLIGTYVDGLIKVCDENGIVRSSFKQTVTATGRLSSTEPNLQNIPVRTPQGRELRKFFVPSAEGRVLVDADYSQIELRLLAAISGDETMLSAFENGIDIHTLTASQVFGISEREVTSEMRKRAKAVNFGIVYGIGAYSLSQDIHVTVATASSYISSYMQKYPAVSAYLENIKRVAREKGYVSTLLSRRRYIPELASAKKPEQAFGERVAMNSPIQGSAADIIKLAMVKTANALKNSGTDAELILQVHDELIIDCKREDAELIKELLKSSMENALQLPVKLEVEISVGSDWYECK